MRTFLYQNMPHHAKWLDTSCPFHSMKNEKLGKPDHLHETGQSQPLGLLN
jgi:hypothetical protein